MTTATGPRLAPCHRLRAHISKNQCEINKKVPLFACTGCKGLPEPMVPASIGLPIVKEQAVPTVLLRFSAPEDQELFQALERVCSDLGHDIISLLHLSCRGDISRAISAKARA